MFLKNADDRIGEDGAATCVLAESWLMLADDVRAALVLLERALAVASRLCDDSPDPGEPGYVHQLGEAVRHADLSCYGLLAIGQTLGSAGTVLDDGNMQEVADTIAGTFAVAAEADLSRVLLLMETLLPMSSELH